MKKNLLTCIALAATLLVGCRNSDSDMEDTPEDLSVKEFKTYTVSDTLCFVSYNDFPDLPEYDTVGEIISYSVAWPSEGMMTPEATRTLMRYYFGDSTSTNIEQAMQRWRQKTKSSLDGQPADSIDANHPFSYEDVESFCLLDSNLATFCIHYSSYGVGAAHGLYDEQYITVDVERGTIIELPDLIDTTHLGEAIAHAIQDLDINRDVRECLFPEFQDIDEMPMTLNYFINDHRDCISVIYGLYEITPYCCSIQTVSLPISWLSQYLSFTPYARQLLGLDNPTDNQQKHYIL